MHVPARLTHLADTLLSRNGEMGSLLVWFVDCDSLGPDYFTHFFQQVQKCDLGTRRRRRSA